MEIVLEVFGTLLVVFGISAGVWAITTGHIYGIFKAANENPIFAIAAIVGIICLVVGLITGHHSLSGAVHDFENGVGWVLTIAGILLLVGMVVGLAIVIPRDRKAAREARASAQARRQPTVYEPDDQPPG